jgi:P4 family phage/plasmid primase-like protien
MNTNSKSVPAQSGFRPSDPPDWSAAKSELGEPPKFHKVGGDFWEPRYEAAILSSILNYPDRADGFLEGLSPEHFFDAHNVLLFGAILRLVNQSREPSDTAILQYLKETEEASLEKWSDYLARLAEVRVDPDDVPKYRAMLDEAVRRRGGATFCVHDYNEAVYAELLRSRLPLVRCIDSTWLAYNGRGIWEPKSRDFFRRMAHDCIHPKQRTHRRIVDLVGQVESALQVSAADFYGAYKRSGDRILINVANGVVEITADFEIEFRAHSPVDAFTAQLHASYDPAARCPLYEQTLEEALPDEPDRQLFQTFSGYQLLPSCEYETALICFGWTNSGKSTAAEGLIATLGQSLCGALDLDALSSTPGYSLASLEHKLVNIASELKATEAAESSNFKKLVSGEPIEVRQIYSEPKTMRSTVKLMFLTNHLPRLKKGTNAELRRMQFLHFANVPAVVDTTLKSRLHDETSGILNWMLEGLITLLDNGGFKRASIQSEKVRSAFAEDNDPVGRFLVEVCDVHPGGEVNKQTLFEAFVEWCHCKGIYVTDTANSYFYRTLRERLPHLQYKRRRFKARCDQDTGDKVRMVVGLRIPKKPKPLTPQSVSEAVEASNMLIGSHAVPLEPLDLRNT